MSRRHPARRPVVGRRGTAAFATLVVLAGLAAPTAATAATVASTGAPLPGAAFGGTLPAAEIDPEAVAHLPWMDATKSPEERASLLVAALTPQQKMEGLAMRARTNHELPNCAYTQLGRHVDGIPELGIPDLRMINGPTGVGGGDCAREPQWTTSMPSAVSIGASFEPENSRAWGDLTGYEVKAIGHNVFLTPGINLVPFAHAGRNYEYYGEDPYLAGVMGIPVVEAIEAHGVQAVPKHFVANEQETERWTMGIEIDHRTLNEMQMLPFEMVIKATDPAAVMCSYPAVNGTWACDSEYLLTTKLRDEFGFSGYVMSDRGATHSFAKAINAGQELEFASPLFFSPANIQAALDRGEVTWATIDRALERRFRSMFELGLFEHNWDQLLPIDYAQHNATAQRLASEGMVLLKNENQTLPLDSDKLADMGDILLVGPDYVVKQARQGFNGPNGGILMQSQSRPILALREELAAHGYQGWVTERDGADLEAARRDARGKSAVIVMVTDNAREMADRTSLSLPTYTNNNGTVTDQEALIRAMAEENDNVIVVLKTSSSVLTGAWENDVEAIVQAWFPGQQDGAAVADILSGDINPGAKMPFTWATAEREASWATEEMWPGVHNEHGQLISKYATGLEQGYRWYQAHDVTSSFPFGFGLSYTSFELGDAAVTRNGNTVVVEVPVTNTGSVAGAEVPQLYLSFPESFDLPPTRLVGFDKVTVEPGQTVTARMVIDPAATNHPVGVYDAAAEVWRNPDGQIDILLGTSSADLATVGTLTMAGGVLAGVTDATAPPEPVADGSMLFIANSFKQTADKAVHLAQTQPGDVFLSGDWDGDGVDTVGIRRGNRIMLWNNDGTGAPATSFYYGRADEGVLVGDWDGNGTDTFAVRRGNVYHFINTNRTGNADFTMAYGRSDDEVKVGDYDGDGISTLAVRRNGNEIFVSNSFRGGEADVRFYYGRPGEVMFTGDWDGDGADTFVIRRDNQWHVRNSLTTGVAEQVVNYGRADDVALAGDWDGDGRDSIAVVRPTFR